MEEAEESSAREMGEWRWEAEFHGWVHTATLAVVTVLVLFVVVLGSFGNTLVLMSAARRRAGKKDSSYDLLLLHLCSADLLVCVLLAPLFLYTLFSDPPLPQFFCGSVFLLGSGLALMSLLSIVAIAVHRQARVAGRGVKHALSRRQTRVVLGVMWVVSGAGAVGATLPAMLGWRESYQNCQVLIHSHDPLMHRVSLFFLSPVIVVSFVVIIVSYIVIARAVRAQNRARIQGLISTFSSSSAINPGTTAENPQDKDSLLRQNEKRNGVIPECRCCSCHAAAERESKAVTMCMVVTVSLVLCWSPLILSQMLEIFTGSSIMLLQVKLCGIALVFLNSALDPYLYAQTQGYTRSRLGKLCWDILQCQCGSSDWQRPYGRTVPVKAVPIPKSSLLAEEASVFFSVKKVIQNLKGNARNVNSTWRGARRTTLQGSRPEFLYAGRQLRRNRCSKSVYNPVPVLSQKGWQAFAPRLTHTVPCPATAVTRDNSIIRTVTHAVYEKRHHNCQIADITSDVTTLGHKSWCRVHVSSEQSLMEL